MKIALLLFVLISLSGCFARVPPRSAVEESAPDKPKDDLPIETPVERSPIDSATNENAAVKPTTSNRKPIGVILFRKQPSISLFANRSPFVYPTPSLLGHHHALNHFNGNLHEDPAFRFLSALFNDRLRPMQPESTAASETEPSSAEASGESSEDMHRRAMNPFESLFPSIFPIPQFPLDDEVEKEGQASTEDKTPVNFEKKENKVIHINGRKFVKTTQVKKVKNDFGQFHSVISSYQPFDEKIHDENGNEKVRPDESVDDKVSSVDKKDVESSTATSERVDRTSSSTAAPNVEKEEATSTSPDLKLVTPEQSESLSKEQDVSKNEIPDKNVEIKVDQMN